MRKKLLCTVAAVAMLSGLFVVGAAPAQATPPTDANNFDPQDSKLGTDTNANLVASPSELVLSDKNDGLDTQAHISSVATTDTTQAIYVVCPQDTDPIDEPVPAPGCETIGTDSSGEAPTGAGQTGLDEAYEFPWSIPSSFDEITRDILSYHCIGAPTDEEPGGNCLLETEEDVFIDDGQSGTSSSSAEYRDYCIDFNGDADCDDFEETRMPFEHPTTIPNLDPGDELVIRARSSDDVTELTSCLDEEADATSGSLDDCTTSDSSGGQAAQAFKDHTFVYTEPEVPDSAEMGFFLYERNGGSGDCATQDVTCELDAHYVVSAEREETEARVFFDPAGNGGPPDPEDVEDDSSCETPDRADTNRVGDNTPIRGCILDQFGVHMDTTVTFESDAEGEFSSCGGGTLQDHDGDGVFEHCHHDSGGPDAEASAVIYSEVPGTQTITYCFDPENDLTDPAPTDHGCADETVRDTLNKGWIAGLPEHIHLTYSGTGSAANPCHTGAKFLQNEVGDRDGLLACVFDTFDNPTSTNQLDGGFLEWSIATPQDDEVDTQFVGTPPPETGTNGRATATIEAISPGQDDPTVTWRDDEGVAQFSDSVTKNVVPREPRARSNVSIRHRVRPHRFVGRVTSPDDSCEPGRRVTVRRVRRGRDPVVGRDTTSGTGRYRVNHDRTRRRFRYYAQVRGNSDCLPDTSGRTPRVR